MEYLILFLIIVGVYFTIHCNIWDLFKTRIKFEESLMDGGIYSNKNNVVTKKRKIKKTAKTKKSVTKKKKSVTKKRKIKKTK